MKTQFRSLRVLSIFFSTRISHFPGNLSLKSPNEPSSLLLKIAPKPPISPRQPPPEEPRKVEGQLGDGMGLVELYGAFYLVVEPFGAELPHGPVQLLDGEADGDHRVQEVRPGDLARLPAGFSGDVEEGLEGLVGALVDREAIRADVLLPHGADLAVRVRFLLQRLASPRRYLWS